MGYLLKVIPAAVLALASLISMASAMPQGSVNFMIGTDMMKPDLYFINMASDQRYLQSSRMIRALKIAAIMGAKLCNGRNWRGRSFCNESS